MSDRVGYQGTNGTFSEIAAVRYFAGQDIEPVGYKNFPSILKDVSSGVLDYAVLPVENTTTGIISRTYDLFKDYDIHAVGEINVQIAENLIVVPGTKMEEIREAYSHPEALSQCQGFFEKHPQIKAMAWQDTAKSVEYVKECNDHSKAALASWRAAEYYEMESLEEHVQDLETNMTRFLVVTNKDIVVKDANKVSMMIVIESRPGSLYNILGILAKKGINITKLESRPIPGKIFEYLFYIDFEGNLKNRFVKEAMHELQLRCSECIVFGNYIAAEH